MQYSLGVAGAAHMQARVVRKQRDLKITKGERSEHTVRQRRTLLIQCSSSINLQCVQVIF